MSKMAQVHADAMDLYEKIVSTIRSGDEGVAFGEVNRIIGDLAKYQNDAGVILALSLVIGALVQDHQISGTWTDRNLYSTMYERIERGLLD